MFTPLFDGSSYPEMTGDNTDYDTEIQYYTMHPVALDLIARDKLAGHPDKIYIVKSYLFYYGEDEKLPPTEFAITRDIVFNEGRARQTSFDHLIGTGCLYPGTKPEIIDEYVESKERENTGHIRHLNR